MQINGIKNGNNGKITIGIPQQKNRYFERMKGLLEDCCISFDPKGSGLLQTSNPLYQVMLLPPADIPKYVEKGIVEVGVGSDEILAETRASAMKLMRLNFGDVRLSVIAPGGVSSIAELNGKTVGTALPGIAGSYFNAINVDVKVEFLKGALELACTSGLVSAIVDQVETGTSIRKAGLVELEKIMDCRYYLISNKEVYERMKANIKPLKTMMGGVLSGEERKFLVFNAPSDTVQGIEKAMGLGIIPCGESPTKMPLVERGAFAYSIVVPAGQLLFVMAELEKLGAMDTIVSDVGVYSKGEKFSEKRTTISELYQTIRNRIENPVSGSYTNELLSSERRLYDKFVEEAGEFFEVVDGEWGNYRIKSEAADLFYVFLAACAKSDLDCKALETAGTDMVVRRENSGMGKEEERGLAYDKIRSSLLQNGGKISEEDALQFLRVFRAILKENAMDVSDIVR